MSRLDGAVGTPGDGRGAVCNAKWISLPAPCFTALAATLDGLCSGPHVEGVFLGGSLPLGLVSPRSNLDLVGIKSVVVTVIERYVRHARSVQGQVIAGPPQRSDTWLVRDRPL